MRIQILTPALGYGGAERLVVLYALGLARRGHAVTVAYGFTESQRAPLDEAGVGAFRLADARLSLRTVPPWVAAYRRVIREVEPDVVHAQSVTAALVARLAAPRLPLLVTLHGIRERHELLAALVFRATRARVTAVSAASAAGIQRFPFAPRVDVLPPAVDVHALDADDGDAPSLRGDPAFCCVARHHPAKGVDVLLRAFPAVLERLPDAVLTLAGHGWDFDENQRLATNLGIAGAVDFLGFVPDAVRYLRQADVVVLPSRREGLPLVALESLGTGRPLVATDVGGTGEVVRDGSTGWLVPPGNPEALAAAMVEAATDPDEAAARGRRGRELVLERFSADATVDRAERHLTELVVAPARLHRLNSRPYYRTVRAVQSARLLGARRPRPAWSGIRILGYHRITEEDDVLAVDPGAFRRQMEALAGARVDVVSLADALDRQEACDDGRCVCITFDDGYRDNLEHAVPVLRELGFPATIFVATAVLDGKAGYEWFDVQPPLARWDELRELSCDERFDVGSHSRRHLRLTRLPDGESLREIAGSRDDLRAALGREPSFFCYPAGQFGPREVVYARDAGYRAAVTTRPGVNDRSTSPFALRRTMLYWRDDREDFEAKLDGRLDRPLALQRAVHRVRVRPARSRAGGREGLVS